MTSGPKSSIRQWIRRGFLLWSTIAMIWLANSVRTQGVPENLLRDSADVTVRDLPPALEFIPATPISRSALIFICGAGIHAHAYVPLLRPIADMGFPVFVVKLPYRFAPLESHRAEAVDRVRTLAAAHPEVERWVIAGHSLGGALAARVAKAPPRANTAFVLIGTTHPREEDLSQSAASFTKVYATNDRIAPADRVLDNRRLLPETTSWVKIDGGNHSQFGNYGHQLFDGNATISRETQQSITREVLLSVLRDDL